MIVRTTRRCIGLATDAGNRHERAKLDPMPELWTPIPEGPLETFVERLNRWIGAFAESKGVPAALVEVELLDGSRFTLDRIEPEPGFGMVTLRLHADDDPDAPDAVIVPLGTIRRIELRGAPGGRASRFGFTVPTAS